MACSCFLAMSSMDSFSSETAALASALPSLAAFSSDSYFSFRFFSSVLATFTASTSSLISTLMVLSPLSASWFGWRLSAPLRLPHLLRLSGLPLADNVCQRRQSPWLGFGTVLPLAEHARLLLPQGTSRR